jgi:hypothetical protein
MERLPTVVTTIMSLRPAFVTMKEASTTLFAIVCLSGNYNKTLKLSKHVDKYHKLVSIFFSSILDDILCASLPMSYDQTFEDVYKTWVGRAFYPTVEADMQVTDPNEAIRQCAISYAAFMTDLHASNLKVPQKYKDKFSNLLIKLANTLTKLENDPIVLRRRPRTTVGI